MFMGVSRFEQALACVRMVNDMRCVNLTDDDFHFLTQNTMWIARERSTARRVIETAVQGSIDIVGFARLRLPIEFVAAVIYHYVKPVNYMTACSAVEGLQYARSIISGVDDFVDPSVLFSLVCELAAGDSSRVYVVEQAMIRSGQMIGVEGEMENGA